MSSQAKPFITPEQYLEIEAKAERKSEYYNGEMFLMAGANSDHVMITGNLAAVFRDQFRERPCYVLSSEMRVRIPKTGLYTYPDVILVCGDRQWESESKTTLLNPTVIIEVLSDSTEAYDRGEKFWHYRKLPSLREYITVSQKAFRIEQYIFPPEGKYEFRAYDLLDDILEVPTVGCCIPLREIYLKTELLN